MRIIDILKICDYEKIELKIKLHYGKNELNQYQRLYTKLINKQLNTILDCDLYIYITAYLESDDEDVKVNFFSEDDTTLYFDVSAYELNSNITYSISASCFSDFLQYKIDSDTLTKFSYESILAHCFYEITCYGFEDNI